MLADNCASAIPLGCPQCAIDGFYERRKLCVAREGRTSRRVRESEAARDLQFPPQGGYPIGGAGMDIVDVPVKDENGGLSEETGGGESG